MMKIFETIFYCESISPIFSYGNSIKDPELREDSLIGVLRFWFRATNPHLTRDELLKSESDLFGSTNAKRSFSIQIKTLEQTTNKEEPTPGKKYPSLVYKQAIVSSIFTIRLVSEDLIIQNQLEKLIHLVYLLGGIGSRTRRGMGCFTVLDVTSSELEPIQGKTTVTNLGKYSIKDCLPESMYNYSQEGISLKSMYREAIQDYPILYKICMGDGYNSLNSLLTKISRTNSTLLKNSVCDASGRPLYEKAMGGINVIISGKKGQYPSPIAVSIQSKGDKFHPVISVFSSPFNESDVEKIRKEFMIKILSNSSEQ